MTLTPVIPDEEIDVDDLEIAAVRARRGALLLDEQQPGWAREIDLGGLDMLSVCDCITGQVFGGYVSGARTLGISGALYHCLPSDEVIRHGFQVIHRGDGVNSDRQAEMDAQALRDAWIAEIEARL